MPTVSTDADAYQDLEDIRQRLDHRGTEFFDDNAQLRFDELLVQLERESRGIFETLWGDQTPLTEEGRVDTKRTTFDAALLLVYPVNDVTKVELEGSPGDDWDELASDRWDFTKHRVILSNRHRNAPAQRGNPLDDHATRPTWRDLAEKIRVTYDRGFGSEPPTDITNIQIQMIQNALTHRRGEQTASAGSPDELADRIGMSEMLTEDLRARISDVTSPGGATLSV